MKQKTIVVLVIVLTGLFASLLSPVAAQGVQPTPDVAKPTPSDNDVNAVAKEMFCPVCENIPLDVCPTTACQEWRSLIRQKLAEGWTQQEIEEYFAQQYGDRVLSEPPLRGLNWLVYVLPPIFFLLGAVVLWRVFHTMRKPTVTQNAGDGPNADPTDTVDETDPYVARLEEELRKKKE